MHVDICITLFFILYCLWCHGKNVQIKEMINEEHYHIDNWAKVMRNELKYGYSESIIYEKSLDWMSFKNGIWLNKDK